MHVEKIYKVNVRKALQELNQLLSEQGKPDAEQE